MNNKNNEKNNKVFKKIQIFISDNLRYILILFSLLFIIFIVMQTYNYFLNQQLKKTSINFFNSIENSNEIFDSLNKIKNNNNIFATLSSLKLIQKNNEDKNYNISNELYKDLIFSNDLDNIYKSTIAIHASYTLINASLIEKTDIYLNDINNYISNISDELLSFISIKNELEYLLLFTDLDIKNIDYKNDSKILEKYNEIYNSNLISSSVKERVKKIHEFQLYN